MTAGVGSGSGEGMAVLIAFSESVLATPQGGKTGACRSGGLKCSPVAILSNCSCNSVLLRRNMGSYSAHLQRI